MTQLREHHLNVFVVNAEGDAIEGATVIVFHDGKAIVRANTTGKPDQPVQITLSAEFQKIELRAEAGAYSDQVTVSADVRNYTFRFEQLHTMKNEPSSLPKAVWIPALVFTAILLGFFITTFFYTPTMTEDQKDTSRRLFAAFCGFGAFFMGGTALFGFDFPKSDKLKMTFSATAGIAVFAFTYSHPPYWFKTSATGAASAPTITNAVAIPQSSPTNK